MKESLSNPYENVQIVDREVIELSSISEDESMIMSVGYGSSTRTVECVEIVDTGLTNLTLRCSVATSYTYDWEALPAEPYREFNHDITSYNQGSVVETTQGGYNRLTSISSSATKTSSTSISQSYSGTYDQYILVGFFWVYVGSGATSGSVKHFIP